MLRLPLIAGMWIPLKYIAFKISASFPFLQAFALLMGNFILASSFHFLFFVWWIYALLLPRLDQPRSLRQTPCSSSQFFSMCLYHISLARSCIRRSTLELHVGSTLRLCRWILGNLHLQKPQWFVTTQWLRVRLGWSRRVIGIMGFLFKGEHISRLLVV
jgi:hypothetical protein